MKLFFMLIILIIFLLSFQQITFSQPKYWQPAGEIYGGHILLFAVNSGGDIFAATRAGLFSSFDAGDHWTRIHEHGDLRSLCICPKGYVYAGAGNSIYRSTDNGATWSEIQVENANIQAMAINSSGHIFLANWDSGIFRSLDDGATWKQINSGLSNKNVFALAINPSGHLFAGTTEGKVFLSTNNGDTWAQRSNGLPNAEIRFIGINSKGHLFALPRHWSIYRSTDNGANWTQITAWAATHLVFDAQDNIYAGAGWVQRSTDNGANWEVINNQLTNSSVCCLAISPNEHIFVGTWHGGGIFRSSNKGKSWQEINQGLTNAYIYSYIIDSDAIIYMATGSGIYRSSDCGQNWMQMNKGLPITDIRAITISAQGYLFAGASNSMGYVQCSMDKGKNWFPINMKMQGYGFTCLLRNSQGHIFAGTEGGVYRSTDDGLTWKEVNQGMTQPYINCLAINAKGHLFAGLQNAGVYRSTNNGDSWTQKTQGLTHVNIYSLLPTSGDTIFAGTWEVPPREPGLFRSTNNGDSWALANTGLTPSLVTSLAKNSAGQLFAGTGQGIFRSSDHGNHWEELDIWSIPYLIKCMAVTSHDHLLAGTEAHGLYRSIESTSDFKNAPKIISVNDVPNDQGGCVTLKWQSSALDFNVNLLSHYSIWRAVPEKPAANLAFAPMNQSYQSKSHPMQRMTEINGKIFAWDWLADQPAHRFIHYTYTAATLYDSMKAVDGKHYFLISAHTPDPNIFYDSEVDSGYSVDNLSPSAPTNLGGYAQNQNFIVHWRPNTENDLKHYLLYRSASPNINMNSISPFAATPDTCIIDSQPLSKEASFYVVVAEDIHGNLSLPSNEIRLSITGIELFEKNMPVACALYQNYPNPFNPTTTIRYELPQSQHVVLKIYDVQGREIMTLVDENQTPGAYKLDVDARHLPSGVYLYRLSAGEFSEVKKFVLIK